ncbi:hypothetical protein J2S14_000818 [Lederbergia wuyishanensis]|uniref:Spore protein n=1 Tax=Lederbergia wuyishanensis TaxID=1347903 RepID=A0ABU0D0U6_9BACI|nr:hypothetical protein [Lederbergia wuyishanensis]
MENKKGQRKENKRNDHKKAGEGNPKLTGPNRPAT